MSSVQHLAQHIEKDIAELMPEMYKSPREKLATMVGCLIETRSCNTMELAAKLPIETDRAESRYAWIERFLSAETIDDMEVMEAVACRHLPKLCENGQTIVVCADQTSLDEDRAIAMLSVRVGDRGMPLFWHVKNTKGNIPINAYLPLLDRSKKCIPEDAEVMVMADRFYGTPEFIKTCQRHCFHYRVRLKGNLKLLHQGGEIRVDEIAKLGYGIKEADLCESGMYCNIGYLHEKGHEEPWFIAMDCEPTEKSVRDYGLRWSIESMFSDFKTRGFNFEDTHLQREGRISRMLLVVTIALMWAIANGQDVKKNR